MGKTILLDKMSEITVLTLPRIYQILLLHEIMQDSKNDYLIFLISLARLAKLVVYLDCTLSFLFFRSFLTVLSFQILNLTLHKKMKFYTNILVNLTKPAGNCGIGHIC